MHFCAPYVSRATSKQPRVPARSPVQELQEVPSQQTTCRKSPGGALAILLEQCLDGIVVQCLFVRDGLGKTLDRFFLQTLGEALSLEPICIRQMVVERLPVCSARVINPRRVEHECAIFLGRSEHDCAAMQCFMLITSPACMLL